METGNEEMKIGFVFIMEQTYKLREEKIQILPKYRAIHLISYPRYKNLSEKQAPVFYWIVPP